MDMDEATLFDAIKLEAELKKSPPAPFETVNPAVNHARQSKQIDWERYAAEREKYRLPNGELRPASMDMGVDERALRTLAFANLMREEIEKIHDYEQKHLWNRFIMPNEIRKLLKRSDYRGG